MPPAKRPPPLWPQYLCTLTLAVTLLTGVLRLGLIDWADRDHCHSLVTKGRWLDSGFKNWQPEGCMLNTYIPATLSPCLKNRRVVFLGDSTVRQLFFTFAHLADPLLPSTHPSDGGKHTDYSLVSSAMSLSVEFVWDPYLNSSRTKEVLTTPSRGKPPALLVLGSGLWYLRNPTSGGLPAWEKMLDNTFSLLHSAQGVADELFFLPVETPVYSKLNPERRRTIRPSDVAAMNSDLRQRVRAPSSWTWSSRSGAPELKEEHGDLPAGEVVLPQVFNDMLDPAQTEDGLHFAQQVLVTQIQVLLNRRCNRLLKQKFPWDRTCCRPYPLPGFVQGLMIFCVAGWGLLARLWISKRERPLLRSFFPSGDAQHQLSIFGLSVLLCYLADRTPLWDKEQKQFDTVWFFGLLLLGLGAGVGTLKWGEKDAGFLNRDQTDEWKGWMQIIILVYHYYGGSQISGIYNPVRVLVAAYLFMTGYGHFHFYYRKADYSFTRIAQVLVRLNMLTVALAYVMNTDYLFYYFAPLVSFWFLVIYFTMLVGAKYNDRLLFLLPKMAASAALVALSMYNAWVNEALFALLRKVFRLPWNAREWTFRVSLDLWIVWLGALTALCTLKFTQHRLAEHTFFPIAKRFAAVLSLATLAWFFWFELTRETKLVYNAYHPYVSFLPITAFVLLRNLTPSLRSSHSRLFAFIGKISLETFILQYHLLLAGDTKGLLIVLPHSWRWANLVLVSLGFGWLSWRVAGATGVLTAWVLGKDKEKGLPTQRLGPGVGEVGNPRVAQGERANGVVREEEIPLSAVSEGKLEVEGQVENGVTSPNLHAHPHPHPHEHTHTHGHPPPPSPVSGQTVHPLIKAFKDDLRFRIGGILLVLWGFNLIWPVE
ncbi:Cas1p-domain-containing protein [Dacryopinax primogenitus]|uniref:Cas1p-domain-containing protein n=1 Tax=Dacryopinax primogenitus (strain DJM 731) TaxID=1858805 RepID=M5FTU1_DACPD|nr:Cas1p-domain-containing protein [Dacryopinax primogenitus]EJU01081.1 Cas1p-domain-containing protein [Dacryopinax primogenitus]